jgi:PPM family protein phosphatase
MASRDRPEEMSARFFGMSEAGQVRAVNQDSFFVDHVAQGVLALVADGMGGHNTGEVASQKAAQVISRAFARGHGHPPSALARAVQAANLAVYEYASRHPDNRGMGTTLTVVYLDDGVGLVAHVGDSRAYLVREEVMTQLTQDHSWVADRVRQGLLSEDEAKRHRWRNVITNALGSSPAIKLDIASFEVRAGDKILLCSDGISMLLADETLVQVVRERDPKEAVRALLDLANARGSPDNVTAVVVAVDALEMRRKRYALESGSTSVTLKDTLGGIRKIESAFPANDPLSRLRRQPWYPQRYWLVGCVILMVLILVFSLR